MLLQLPQGQWPWLLTILPIIFLCRIVSIRVPKGGESERATKRVPPASILPPSFLPSFPRSDAVSFSPYRMMTANVGFLPLSLEEKIAHYQRKHLRAAVSTLGEWRCPLLPSQSRSIVLRGNGVGAVWGLWFREISMAAVVRRRLAPLFNVMSGQVRSVAVAP